MPRMRFNHMELTVPRGSLDDRTRDDLRRFYCDGFGWHWVDFPIEDQVAPMLVPDDRNQFLLIVETDEPMRVTGFEHLGLLLESEKEVDELAALCQEFAENDDRVDIAYVGENLVLEHSRVHFFYVRYLLPIYFDVSAYSYDPGHAPRYDWRLVDSSQA